uniref:Uncharacterized protein n=1 Tax=Anguilla anguilla TaxID=7936 RepID=A0A0E9PWK3_ANGAN
MNYDYFLFTYCICWCILISYINIR